jgi:hypothetical protein
MKNSTAMLTAALVMLLIAAGLFAGVQAVEVLKWGVWVTVLQGAFVVAGSLFTIGFGIGLATAVQIARKGK